MKKISNYLKELLSISPITILLLLDELLVRIFCNLNILNQAVLLEIIACLCLSFILSLFKPKLRNILSSLILLIYTIYSFAQTMHYAFFKSFFSLRKLSIIGELKDVTNEAITKLEIQYLLFLLPIILFFLYIKKMPKKEYSYPTIGKIIISVVCIFFLVLIKDVMLEEYNENTSDITSDSYLYNNINNNLRFYNEFGSFEYIIKDAQRLKVKDSDYTLKDIVEINDFIKESKREKSDLQGIYEGKNLILILCESFGPQSIKEDLTPTLYKLSKEGTYFTNYYAPLYPSNTNDSEFMSQTGMMPSIDYGTTSKDFGDNLYPYALANLFKQEGYSVNSYHSHVKSFYSRETLHNSFGFEYLYDKEDLGLVLDGKEFNNWIDDSLLFEKVIENTDTSKPFYDFVITTSGHMPYYSGRKEIIENYNKVKKLYPTIPDQAAYYYAAQMKLDEGIKVLLEKLEEKGVLEDTVIMLFGDHYPYGIDHQDTLNYFYGKLENSYDIYKTPFIIYDPTSKGEENNTLSSTFDIFPTITSLFNLDDFKAYTVGEDLFVQDDNRYVLFPDYSVLADDFYYDASSQTIIGKNTSNILDMAAKHYKYSQIILSSNYYQLIE